MFGFLLYNFFIVEEIEIVMFIIVFNVFIINLIKNIVFGGWVRKFIFLK